MKYQLWNKDEYGMTSIVGTFLETKEAIQKARELVTASNFSNSLSSNEQMRNIESYFVDLKNKKGSVDEKVIYSGNRRGGKHCSLKIGEKETSVMDITDTEVLIYVGSKFAKDKTANKQVEEKVYLKDEKGNLVTKIDHSLLKSKSVYFVVPLEV